jgi:hypothetical protein
MLQAATFFGGKTGLRPVPPDIEFGNSLIFTIICLNQTIQSIEIISTFTSRLKDSKEGITDKSKKEPRLVRWFFCFL